MEQLIALCGPMGSGKTTLAASLSDFYPTSFASPLKTMIGSLLYFQHLPADEVDKYLRGNLKNTPTEYLGGQSPRHAMQTLGTEWRDLINKNLWLNIWFNANKHRPKVVVDDMRFLHEADFIHSIGGKIITVRRPGYTSGIHPSEYEYLSIRSDEVIFNNGPIEKAAKDLRALLNKWY